MRPRGKKVSLAARNASFDGLAQRKRLRPWTRDYLRQLLQNAINAAMTSVFWKISLPWTLLILAVLLGIVLYFGLYWVAPSLKAPAPNLLLGSLSRPATNHASTVPYPLMK